MKNILFYLIIIFITSTTNVFSDAIKKSGFLDSKTKIIKSEEINDPKNKIILIYNHGQDSLIYVLINLLVMRDRIGGVLAEFIVEKLNLIKEFRQI